MLSDICNSKHCIDRIDDSKICVSSSDNFRPTKAILNEKVKMESEGSGNRQNKVKRLFTKNTRALKTQSQIPLIETGQFVRYVRPEVLTRYQEDLNRSRNNGICRILRRLCCFGSSCCRRGQNSQNIIIHRASIRSNLSLASESNISNSKKW